jgi:carboxyl-terminal processing protease
MKHRWSITVLVAALSFLSGGWLLQRGTGGDGGVYQQARLFDDVLNHVRNFYVDSIPEAELYTKATNGMLDELKDPYSVLLTGADFKISPRRPRGNYAGLGIQIDVRDGGSPSWRRCRTHPPRVPASDRRPDRRVDGKSTQGWNSDQAVKALRGNRART